MFDLLKAHLTSAPVLIYTDFSHPFDLETDTSLQGFGVVLSQKDEHSEARLLLMPASPFASTKEIRGTIVWQN